MEKSLAKRNTENSWLWLVKIIAGLLVILMLGLHFIVNHLLAPNGLLSYAEVVAYYKIPIIPIIEVIFLITVITHAFIGLRSIVLDLNPSPTALRWVNIFLVLLGSVCIFYGTWLVIVITGR
jgi:succinate dehydrogenase / fumarate reductase membrane anchor subunit